MGVDSDFYLKGSWTDEQKKSFEEAAKDRGLWGEYGKLVEYEDGAWLSFYSLSRYYGTGYERGHWPYIHSIFLLLKHHFPDAQLYYGGDAEPEECVEVTDGYVASLWAHWLSPEGEKYWKRKEANMSAPNPERVDANLEIIALEILGDNKPEELVSWVNGIPVKETDKTKIDAYELGYARKRHRDAKIVRTNGLSDERGK